MKVSSPVTVADAALLDRRPIAIKVSQFPRRVRPQSGLSLADLVFEHYAEAGVTQFVLSLGTGPLDRLLEDIAWFGAEVRPRVADRMASVVQR